MPLFSPRQHQRKVVDVGAKGDCGFRAVAAGILDNFLTYPKLNEALLSTVLDRHFAYFPMHRSASTGLATPHVLMRALIHEVPMPELIATLAYTLRQLAVDEMVLHPEKYKGAFVQHHEQTSPECMRKPGTWIDETSLCALAFALKLPIHVQKRSDGQELKLPLWRYNSTVSSRANPNLVVELKNAHYQPKVNHPASFNLHDYTANIPMKPIVSDCASDDEMPAVLALITKEEARIEAEYLANCKRFDAMLKARELTTKNLVAMYIKGMGTSDYLAGRVQWVDRERGDHHFSRRLAENHLPQHTAEQAIVSELVKALSRALSVGQMRYDIIFENMPETPSSSACRLSR